MDERDLRLLALFEKKWDARRACMMWICPMCRKPITPDAEVIVRHWRVRCGTHLNWSKEK